MGDENKHQERMFGTGDSTLYHYTDGEETGLKTAFSYLFAYNLYLFLKLLLYHFKYNFI